LSVPVPFRLVAADLDHTLLRSDGSVSAASVQTLAQWALLGARVVPVTIFRDLQHAVPDAIFGWVDAQRAEVPVRPTRYIAPDEVIAFGDGEVDIPMLQ